jgi:hypothetical protein
MKEPLPVQSWNFVPASSFIDTWFLRVDNPNWGNNAEASTSSGARRPRLQLIHPIQYGIEEETIPRNNSEHNSGALSCAVKTQTPTSSQAVCMIKNRNLQTAWLLIWSWKIVLKLFKRCSQLLVVSRRGKVMDKLQLLIMRFVEVLG